MNNAKRHDRLQVPRHAGEAAAMNITLYDIASRYVGVRALDDGRDHPLIQWWLSLCFDGDLELKDETPWCSAALNGWAWELRLPRSKSAAARSWLNVGQPVSLHYAKAGFDVVVLWRGSKDGWQGHVGLFGGHQLGEVLLLGGNQGSSVSVAAFPADRVLGVRRLLDESV